MIKKIKHLLTAAAFSLMLVAPLAVPAAAGAQNDPNSNPSIQGSLCQGAELKAPPPGTTPTDATCDATTATSGGNINDLIADVINIFSLIVGVVAVIMIIIGGFKYITSNGNDSQVASAKNTILYAIIGLVIVALAQFIVRFVLSRVTS